MKLGNAVLGIFAIFLLIGVFAPSIIDGIKTWRTDGLTSQDAIVATAGGVTTANITLTKDLYQANIVNLDDITSTDEDDTPVGTDYDEDTLVLAVAGLEASTSRTLTISYYGETDQSVMRVIGPFLGVLIIGGLLAAIAWGMFHNKKGIR
jgi:hypothetical protein